MDSNAPLRALDESHHRELPQLSLRIAPLRDPVASRTLRVPSPLEPNASGGARESQTISKSNASTKKNTPSTTKEALPTVTEFLNAARTERTDPASSSHSSAERPPKPILPAFVNLRALERVPFSSSFDDNTPHGQHKRRRLELQAESFGEHLQLPIPQASHKEQRPPPFGPFAILNGLNEPPPNAALLPPIEAGSITQLLTKPSRGDAAAAATAAVDPSTIVSVHGTLVEGQSVERREAKIEEFLGATLDENAVDKVHVEEPGPFVHPQNADETKPAVIEKEEPTAGGVTSSGKWEGSNPLSPKSRGRSRKNLRKWTEEETMALLHGAVKCGIGNWTTILAQPELNFNKRTASNLKDRFRVCCPWAYRASDSNEATKQLRDYLANALHQAQTEGFDEVPGKSKFPITNPTTPGSESASRTESPTTNSQKPSASSMSPSTPDTEPGFTKTVKSPPTRVTVTRTLSDESQSTLESLGIPEPHVAKKSKRRSRNLFTTAEDEALIKGYATHGFQWTLIQQDPALNLGHRRATDLRDRFRTKFPNAYRHGGSVSSSSANQSKREPSGTPTPTPVPVPRDRLPSTETTPANTPTKISGISRSNTHSRHPSSTSHSNLGPIDPSFLPPPPGFAEQSTSNPTAAAMLSFPLDENQATSPWEDNTLAPMIWDDLS